MKPLKVFILSVDYRIVGGSAVIELFCRTVDGERVCLKDFSFRPYFYVRCNPDLKDELSKLTAEDGKCFVTGVEPAMKKILEQDVELFRVFVNLPSSVPVIKDAVRNLFNEIDVYEYDIPFAKRYLIDKNLTPMMLAEAVCDDGLRIQSIKTVGNETFDCPKILAVDIETYFDDADKRILPEKNPILMIALYGKEVKKVLTWKKFSTNDNSIEFLDSEAEMILRMCWLIREQEPDIVAGYFSDGFDFPYLAERAKKNNILLDFGKSAGLKITGSSAATAELGSIIHIDVFKFIRKVISRSMETDIFTLDAVAGELLGEHKHIVDLQKMHDAWNSHPEHLEKFCNYNLHDAKLAFELCVKVLPNLIELAKTIGLPLFDVNRMSFSQLVEAYIMKNALLANEIAPNKPDYREKQARLGDRIKGAFVFEPKPGLYKNIAVFDYRSLYPSIIASHNISPGTLNCECCKTKTKVHTDRGDYWFCDKKKGFLSAIIQHLIEVRAEIKAQIKSGKKDAMTIARSEALKVLANSFYGYLGFYAARWYCKECAESTTAFGRQYIHKVIDAAQNEGFTVLYSDTDSAFLLLEKKTKQDALNFAAKINESLPGVMELDYECLYPAGIFVSAKATDAGAKKKYALIDEKGVLKIRGFETVRRNWSFIAKDVQKAVIETVLKEKNVQKAVSYLQCVINDLRAHIIPVDRVVIYTQLQREVSSYVNVTPHVAAAQRMKDKGIEAGAGTMLKFVIVKGEGRIRDKVRLSDEAKQSDYDAEYYINNQIIPAVERIFAVFGIDKESFLADKSQVGIDRFLT